MANHNFIFAAFQYRKRYEVYCNFSDDCCRQEMLWVSIPQAVWGLLQSVFFEGETFEEWFQYRKRYEVYCNGKDLVGGRRRRRVSIPQAVWGLLQYIESEKVLPIIFVSIPQAVWGLLQSGSWQPYSGNSHRVSIPQAVWGLLQYDLSDFHMVKSYGFQYRKRYEVYCNM